MPDESAILIPVPRAEELVGVYRDRYDPGAKAGVPAHITFIPHLTVADVDDAVALEAVVEKFQSDAESHLPMMSRAEEVWLMVERNGKWRKHTSFTL